MPLNIIIVGAGIAGLCAAVALRQAGHSVVVFEKSQFATEVGAALVLSSNGTRVLSKLGFSFERARGCPIKAWDTLDGTTLGNIGSLDLGDAEERYGAPLMSIHRVDLHNELLRLATTDNGRPKVKLLLSSRVVEANAEEGSVVLLDGSVKRADLIVAADGVHSVLKGVVLGGVSKASPTGLSAFRFLIPTERFRDDLQLVEFLKWKCKGPTIFADTRELKRERERHIVWYDCQGGEVQNFVGIHPDFDKDPNKDHMKSMMQEFAHFHPNVRCMIQKASEITRWPLFAYDPLPGWSRGKIILIGDAAHPMLPFGGQGANQALEDAGALGYLLNNVNEERKVGKRIKMFETVRRKRASRVQILSKVRVGKEQDVREELLLYADPSGSVPGCFAERNAHDYGFDVFEVCAQVEKDPLRVEGASSG